MTPLRSITALTEFAALAASYATLRAEHPRIPARTIHAYLRSDDGCSFAEFTCPGHEWSSGYDDSDHEVASYCYHCGACGDA